MRLRSLGTLACKQTLRSAVGKDALRRRPERGAGLGCTVWSCGGRVTRQLQPSHGKVVRFVTHEMTGLRNDFISKKRHFSVAVFLCFSHRGWGNGILSEASVYFFFLSLGMFKAEMMG